MILAILAILAKWRRYDRSLLDYKYTFLSLLELLGNIFKKTLYVKKHIPTHTAYMFFSA